MTNSLEHIYSNFIASNDNTPDFVIDFYDRNFICLNNIKQFADKQQLQQYIAIVYKYAEAIYRKHRYNSVIDFVNKQQLLIDNEILQLDPTELKDSWYYSLQFVKGMASYDIKDYKTASTIFKKLVRLDSQNELYRTWLNYSQYGLKRWLLQIISIVCFGLIGTVVIFKSQIHNYYVHQALLTVGVLGLFLTLIYESYIKRNQRRRKARDGTQNSR